MKFIHRYISESGFQVIQDYEDDRGTRVVPNTKPSYITWLESNTPEIIKYIETIVPEYDADTQYLGAETVTEFPTKTVISHNVEDYTVEEMEQRILDAKSSKVSALKSSAESALSSFVRDSRNFAKDKISEVDAATTLDGIRTIDFDPAVISDSAGAAKAIFEGSILWDIDYANVDTYIDNNVTTLAEAKAYLKKLSKVVVANLKFNGLIK